jgi:hypothetical protein
MVMRRRKGEGVSTAQLKLFLEELEAEEDVVLDASSEELAKEAGLDPSTLKEKEERKARKKNPSIKLF